MEEQNNQQLLVLDIISRDDTISQRHIAQQTGFSLGLTNLIIKKLIKTGYIKIKYLNGRKIKYILTTKGFSEKAKKTYNYVIKTTNYFFEIYEKLKKLINEEYQNGKREFYVLSSDEIYNVVEFIFRTIKLDGARVFRIQQLPKELKNNKVLYLVADNNFRKDIFSKNNNNIIDLLSYLME